MPLAFKAFGFDPDSVSLKFEEVELPISIDNKHLMSGQSFSSTFLVSCHNYEMIRTGLKHYGTVVPNPLIGFLPISQRFVLIHWALQKLVPLIFFNPDLY